VIEYTWDTEEKEPKTLLLSKISKCAGHAALSDPDAYERVKLENKWINRAFERLVALASAKWEGISYRFVDDRVIEVTHPRIAMLSTLQKAQIQTAIDTQIGAGRVRIV
jgi:hypothetical protein